MSLMLDSGDTKDDVKVPEDDVGAKINKLFREEEKDTSKEPALHVSSCANQN